MPWQVSGEGIVLVPRSDGTYAAQRTGSGFARHFDADGVAILPPEEKIALADPTPPMSLLDTAAAPNRVQGRPEIIDAIEQTAMRYGGHPALRRAGMSVTEWRLFFRSNIEVESGYNPRARSHVGAIGLGQLMPGTAAKLRVDPHNVAQNLDGSARYLLMLLDRFGSKELALAGYNAGPEAVAKHGGIPPYRETQGHVRKVMAVFARLNGDLL